MAKLHASFRGHAQPVLSLSFDKENGKLASGSGDGVLHLFDVNTSQSGFKFAFDGMDEENEVAALAFTPGSQNLLVSSGQCAYVLDPRSSAQPVLMAKAADQINSIAIPTSQPSANTAVFADDAGDISTIDIRKPNGKLLKTWTAHTNICMHTAFGATPSDLYSGGFDYHIHRWDISNGARLDSINISTVTPNTDQSNTNSEIQSINPPFVYNLAMHPSATSNKMAAALGNGSVVMMLRDAGPKANKKKKTRPCVVDAVVPVHSWSCTVVEFWKCESLEAGTGDVVISGGLDGCIGVLGVPGSPESTEQSQNQTKTTYPVKGKYSVGRKVDGVICLGEGVNLDDGRATVRVAVAGCATTKKRDAGAVDVWDVPI
ncbi:WD repeat-containing protein 53 [Chytriomyces hyalinus]|nr:WD repeat-containing protein 53 [Chytriomyces hyalinus]